MSRMRLRKLFSATVALMLALCMLLPTSVFARQEWDGVKVGYKHITKPIWSRDPDKTITNLDDNSKEWVFCVCPNRDATSQGTNADYRFRYNLNNNAWMFDNTQNINRRDGKSSDYMLDSGSLEVLAKVLYIAQEGNGGMLAGNRTYSYDAIQNAVYWAVINGKGDPNQYSIGQIYRGNGANDIITQIPNTTLPANWTLWLYVPDSNGAGNLQNTVNLTYRNTPPTPPKKVKIKFNLKKELIGEGAPELKDGQFTFVFTGDNGLEARVTNKADGTIESPVLEFTDDMLWDDGQRTFAFTITEEEGKDPTINYDEKKVDVDVNVQKRSSDGELIVNIWGRNFADSVNNSETPAVFESTINTFTNEYTKPEAGPEITNTTVDLNGTKALSDQAAKYEANASETIDVTLKDDVTYSNLDSEKTYTIVSTVMNEKGQTVGTPVETQISGESEGTKTVEFPNLTDTGTYSIKTELKDESGSVIYTHNGKLDDKEETAEITKTDESGMPKITNTTAKISNLESTASKPAEYVANASEYINLSLTDTVKLSDLFFTENRTEYKVKSELYKDGAVIQTKETILTKEEYGDNPPTEIVVKFDDPVDKEGKYSIKTTLFNNDTTQEIVHNGELNLNSETFIVSRSPYNPAITNTTAITDKNDANKKEVASRKAAIQKNVGADESFSYTLHDEVWISGRDPEGTYTLVSTLYKNGEAQANPIEKTIDSTTDIPVEVEFSNLSEIGRYTIKTELKLGDQVVSTHNGKLSERAESVNILSDSELKTTVKTDKDSATSGKELTAYADELTSFTDVIEYKNLSGGKTYKVTGKLKEINENGEVVQNEDGSEYNVAEAEGDFKAEVGGSGTWELDFDEVTLEPGKKYVVFEEAVNIKDAKDKSEHKNPSDKAQTIVTKEEPGIKISKKLLGGEEISGAKMKLTGGPDNISKEWTSKSTPEEFSVKPGDYTLTEVVAPKGLKTVTTKMNFTVDSEGKVNLKTTTVDNGGKITTQDGNHIVLEDAPVEPELIKTVNSDKKTKFKSVNGTVEFEIKATVPYGVTSFKIMDSIPDPLLYVDDSIKATLGGKDLFQYDPANHWYGYSVTDDKNVEVEVLSPVVDGAEGPSNIPPEEAWGKEVVVTIKCKIDPEEDLSKYKDPVVNIALLEMDGTVLAATEDNQAAVLGIYDLADNDDARGAKTGDDAPIGWAVVGLLSAALALDLMRRRRMSN